MLVVIVRFPSVLPPSPSAKPHLSIFSGDEDTGGLSLLYEGSELTPAQLISRHSPRSSTDRVDSATQASQKNTAADFRFSTKT